MEDCRQQGTKHKIVLICKDIPSGKAMIYKLAGFSLLEFIIQNLCILDVQVFLGLIKEVAMAMLSYRMEAKMEENRIALIGIIVEDISQTDRLNKLLSEYGQHIVGRMGVPYRDRGVCIISVIIDAKNDVISSLSGKLGMIKGLNVKTIYAKMPISTPLNIKENADDK